MALVAAALAGLAFTSPSSPISDLPTACPLNTSGGRTALEGVWEEVGHPGQLLAFAGMRYYEGSDGQVRLAAKILSFNGSKLRLCDFGREVVRNVTLRDRELSLGDSTTGLHRVLRRTSISPTQLAPVPWALGKAGALPASRVERIQGELEKRAALDQMTLSASGKGNDFASFALRSESSALSALDPTVIFLHTVEVAADNAAFLKKCVADVGWIDVTRFGYPAAKAAFLIAQHSFDLPLMLAVLPAIKRDVEANLIEAEVYGLLFDRLQLALGEKQHYGSQIGYDNQGLPLVLPVDHPEGLADRRQRVGMPPLESMLRHFGADQVRVSAACGQE